MSDNFTVVKPSYNPADTQNLSGVLDFYAKKILMQIEKAAPAKIISYDRDTNRAVIQILNYSITSDGDNVARKPLADIPVFCFGGGDTVLSFPIKEGDLGFLYASDGDISVFKKLLQIFAPATYQKHKYKDGVFYPLILNGFTIAADDKEAVVLSSLDGQTKISLKDGNITLDGANITDKSTNKTTQTTALSVTATTASITATTTHNGTFTSDGLSDTTAATGVIVDSMGKALATVENGIIKTIAE